MIESRWLTASAKAWLTAIAGLATVDGAIWLLVPGFAKSTAYDLVIELAPQPVWGWAMTISGSLASVALWQDGKRLAAEAARAAMAIYALVCFVVGLSIAALTLDGVQSALTGASKWWAISIVCVLYLAGPSLTTRNRVTLLQWFGSFQRETAE